MSADDSRPLQGRVALVTGGARNIGRAIALGMAAAGARVAVNARADEAAAQEVVSAIEHRGGAAMAVLADVGERADVDRMVSSIEARLGPVTIVVNNAAFRSPHPFEELPAEVWERALRTSLYGAYHCSQAVAAGMRREGYGRIISITGVDAHDGHPGTAHVAAAKAGVEAMTRVIARELGGAGVTANCVSPGAVSTERPPDPRRETAVEAARLRSAVQRLASVDEIARVCVFLALPDSGSITGQVLHVNGGSFLGR
jgi:3-oxoacyl-[acyl-carrier protein] reductase